MITWSSKPLIALAVVTTLAACDDAMDPSTLLAGLAPPEDAAKSTVPLTQAMMMRGNVTLVPPAGYCIDSASLTQSFALLGRCDALGAVDSGTSAPVGVMTVSIARSAKSAPLPSAADVAAASAVGTPQDTRKSDTSLVFKTTGPAPEAGLSPQHWRALAKLGRYTIGAALFGPKGHRAVTAEGADLLADMLKRTMAKTNAS
jgi:hypothetical protein